MMEDLERRRALECLIVDEPVFAERRAEREDETTPPLVSSGVVLS
jgi:hypothetical protein